MTCLLPPGLLETAGEVLKTVGDMYKNERTNSPQCDNTYASVYSSDIIIVLVNAC